MDTTLRMWPNYQTEISEIRAYYELNKAELQNRISRSPINSYAGRRGSMVVDAICSRRRQYETRVLPMVALWESQNEQHDLESLAFGRVPSEAMGLMKGEELTLRNVAERLRLFGSFVDSKSDDETCFRWATSVEPIRYVHDADEFVGAVSGVGPALFSYLRILSGVDAIKPDVRVREKMAKEFGVICPKSDVALMHMCEVYAEDLGISRTQFDQLMWEKFPDDSEIDKTKDDGAGMLVLRPGEESWKPL